MTKIYNRENQKYIRKKLRNNMTKEEVVLWSKLKGKQLCNYKFRRQHGVGRYVVDFCCLTKKLIVELDGDQHGYEENYEYDLVRTKFLKQLGFEVLRFTNWQVRTELKMVIDTIFVSLEIRPPLSSPP